MTPKERMLRVGRGEWADRLPWAPRMDLWYNANSYRGTLPPQYRSGVTLDEIADDIGGAYHKVVGDYLHARTPEDHLDRAIGVQHRWGLPYRRELVGVDREVKREGDTTEVIYHTLLGSVSCKTKYTDEMRRAGISIAWKAERVIKKPEDYKILGYIFKNIKIHPDYENYLDYKNKVGEKGIAVGRALAAELGLGYPEAPWHTHRDQLAALMCACGILAGSLGKMARDIAKRIEQEMTYHGQIRVTVIRETRASHIAH